MNILNYKQISYPKKTLLINKIDKPSIIPNYNEKTEYLFQDPENYLKLPYETSFHFVIGKKPKGPRFDTDKTVIPYSIVGTLAKKEGKTFARKKSVILNTAPSSKSLRKSMRLSKLKSTPPHNMNHDITSQLDDKKKKKNNMINISHTDVYNIFKQYKKRINKNKSENIFKNSRKLYKEMPKTMYQYINAPLSQQERALKSNEKYNTILRKIESNIIKSLNSKKKNNIINNNNIDNNNNQLYNTSKLINNSSAEYRMKVEKINLNEKKKFPNLTLNNHVQNWEMSLRRPKNFIGERRELLNIRTDQKPFWTIYKENNPSEDEKIINQNLNIKEKSGCLTTHNNFMNNLNIKGKKLIDIEEKMANELKGNIKIMNLKYDRESLKDLIFKINYSINKHSFGKK